MIVTASVMLVSRWPRASHQPAKISQMTLPTQEGAPASVRSRVVRPKGHRTYPAMRKEAMLQGMVMMKMKQMIPATA